MSPSAHPHDRAGRRHFAGRHALGVVPAGLSAAQSVSCLSKLSRRLFLTRLLELHAAGRLAFFGDHAGLREERAFQRLIARLRKKNWVVYATPPFGGPEAVLAYLSLTRTASAISNRRLITSARQRTRRHLPLQGLSP